MTTAYAFTSPRASPRYEPAQTISPPLEAGTLDVEVREMPAVDDVAWAVRPGDPMVSP